MNFNKGLLLMLFLGLFLGCFGQELKSPSVGKSLVYFARTSGTGALINFKYFDGDKYLGKFSGYNYMMYECDPGEHFFWVTAENRDFVNAELLADKTYIIQVVPRMGAIKASVKIFPVAADDEKRMKRVMKLIGKRDPKVLDVQKTLAESDDLQFFIKNGLEKYERLMKGSQVLKVESNMSHN